jgi:AcrR family transcriptional regulator
MSKKLAPNPTRHAQILACAEQLFIQLGYRAVTMERIITESGLAKATLYAYFSGKEDVFRQVAEAVADRMAQAVRQELNTAGSVTDRVCRALGAKQQIAMGFVHMSPHAHELFAAKNALVRERFKAVDRDTIAALGAIIAEAIAEGGASPDASQHSQRLARLLFDAATGMLNASVSADQLRADMQLLVGRVLDPELA